jgi:hypothetical protein
LDWFWREARSPAKCLEEVEIAVFNGLVMLKTTLMAQEAVGAAIDPFDVAKSDRTKEQYSRWCPASLPIRDAASQFQYYCRCIALDPTYKRLTSDERQGTVELSGNKTMRYIIAGLRHQRMDCDIEISIL